MGLSKSLLGSQSISSQFPPLLQLAFGIHGARKLILKRERQQLLCLPGKSSCAAVIGVQTVSTVTRTIEIILA